MKTNIEKFFTIGNDGWHFYLLPSIWFDYEKDNFFHGKQFIITFVILFWEINIEFNEH